MKNIILLMFTFFTYKNSISQLVYLSREMNDKSASKTIKFGQFEWMEENLNVDVFLNGDLIPEAKTKEQWLLASINKTPAWCYYNNDTLYAKKYKKLYNWFAITDPRGLAPVGFHIATDSEWNSLKEYLDQKEITKESDKKNNILHTPGGYRNHSGDFSYMGTLGFWWISDIVGNNVSWCYKLDYANAYLCKIHCVKSYGLSIRCVKNYK